MRLLLTLLFTATTLFSQANNLKDEDGSSMTIGCVVTSVLLLGTLIAAAYVAITIKKRHDANNS